MVCHCLTRLASVAGPFRKGALWLLCVCASATASWAQARPQPATRPQAVPSVTPAPKVIITPSAKPLAPVQLEEALRRLLKADSMSRHAQRQGLEAEGLVLDQALSKLGHDFYDAFYSQFEAPNGLADFIITVTERPGRGNTSLVVLTVNETELLELPLVNHAEQLQETVAYAVGTAQDFLVDAQNIGKQLEAGQKAPIEVY